MPIKSKDQWGYLFAKHPKMAKRWAHETRTPFDKLPEHVKKGALAMLGSIASRVELPSNSVQSCTTAANGVKTAMENVADPVCGRTNASGQRGGRAQAVGDPSVLVCEHTNECMQHKQADASEVLSQHIVAINTFVDGLIDAVLPHVPTGHNLPGHTSKEASQLGIPSPTAGGQPGVAKPPLFRPAPAAQPMQSAEAARLAMIQRYLPQAGQPQPAAPSAVPPRGILSVPGVDAAGGEYMANLQNGASINPINRFGSLAKNPAQMRSSPEGRNKLASMTGYAERSSLANAVSPPPRQWGMGEAADGGGSTKDVMRNTLRRIMRQKTRTKGLSVRKRLEQQQKDKYLAFAKSAMADLPAFALYKEAADNWFMQKIQAIWEWIKKQFGSGKPAAGAGAGAKAAVVPGAATARAGAPTVSPRTTPVAPAGAPAAQAIPGAPAPGTTMVRPFGERLVAKGLTGASTLAGGAGGALLGLKGGQAAGKKLFMNPNSSQFHSPKGFTTAAEHATNMKRYNRGRGLSKGLGGTLGALAGAGLGYAMGPSSAPATIPTSGAQP